MKLLVYITNNQEHIYPILSKMMEQHIPGATVVDCEGMLRAVSEKGSEPLPMLHALRGFLSPVQDSGKMLFAALEDAQVKPAIDIIHSIAGDLRLANRGVLFTLPIDYCELTQA